MEEAEKALDRKQYRLAIRLFSNALTLDPKDPNANYGLAKTYYFLNQLSKAENFTAKALEINPSSPDLYNLLFCIKMNQKADNKILHMLAEKAYALAPNDPKSLNNMGIVTLDTGDQETNIQYLEKAISIDPKNYVYHLNLSFTYSKLKKTGLAFRQAQESYHLHPSLQTGYILFISFINTDHLVAKLTKIVLLSLWMLIIYASTFSMFIWNRPWLVAFPVFYLLLLLISGINLFRHKSIFNGVVRTTSSLVLIAIFVYIAIYQTGQ
jgi:tetratricopeptide (TPR) repeat protein